MAPLRKRAFLGHGHRRAAVPPRRRAASPAPPRAGGPSPLRRLICGPLRRHAWRAAPNCRRRLVPCTQLWQAGPRRPRAGDLEALGSWAGAPLLCFPRSWRCLHEPRLAAHLSAAGAPPPSRQCVCNPSPAHPPVPPHAHMHPQTPLGQGDQRRTVRPCKSQYKSDLPAWAPPDEFCTQHSPPIFLAPPLAAAVACGHLTVSCICCHTRRDPPPGPRGTRGRGGAGAHGARARGNGCGVRGMTSAAARWLAAPGAAGACCAAPGRDINAAPQPGGSWPHPARCAGARAAHKRRTRARPPARPLAPV
jgi:hypothetical protein